MSSTGDKNMKIKKTVLATIAMSFCFYTGCAVTLPYKILSQDNSVIESKKVHFEIPVSSMKASNASGSATYTAKGITYQKTDSSSWDTIKAEKLSFVAKGNMISFISPTGLWKFGEVDKVAFDTRSVCMKAKMNAINGYSPSTGIYVGNFISGFLIGLLGVIPAGITASAPVPIKNVAVPDTMLLKDKDYKNCLMQEAQKIKSDRAWSGWLMGLTLWFTLMPIFFI
jgi:ABC-type uncharacterized transport system permease subunit